MSKAEWSGEIIAVDWGTTNRRAYLLDASGTVLSQFEDELGVTSIPQGEFPAAAAAIRVRLGDKPMLLAGMIGSNRGWHEAAYLPCPAGLAEVAARLTWVDPQRTAIVPGLSFVDAERADVMRGEEVQLFGLVTPEPRTAPSSVCHPGTHSKWARLEAGRVTSFTTVMTGELFSMLRTRSVLAPSLQEPVVAGEAFKAGVERTFGGAQLTAELFSIRASVLLSRMYESDAAAYCSGLLIGSDLRAGMALSTTEEMIVLGRPSLTGLYAVAMRHCGFKACEVDGATAFVAGMQAIREIID